MLLIPLKRTSLSPDLIYSSYFFAGACANCMCMCVSACAILLSCSVIWQKHTSRESTSLCVRSHDLSGGRVFLESFQPRVDRQGSFAPSLTTIPSVPWGSVIWSIAWVWRRPGTATPYARVGRDIDGSLGCVGFECRGNRRECTRRREGKRLDRSSRTQYLLPYHFI